MPDDRGSAGRRAATPQNWALLIWFLIFLGAFTQGAGSVLGAIAAHLMRPRLAETAYGSHMVSAARTFWIGLVGAAAGFALGSAGLEDPGRWLVTAVGLWSLFRVVRGFVWAAREKPIGDPTGWL